MNNLKLRIAVALALSLGAGSIVAYQQLVRHGLGLDFLWIWRATKIVLDGGDPYVLIQPFGDADWSVGVFFYPLPAIGFGLPFVWLGPEGAATAFFVCSTFLLAFAVTRDGFYRLPLFFSAPFFVACRAAQMSAATMGLALIAATAGLSVMKPNLGLAMFIRQPRRWTVVSGGLLLVGSAIISPNWPSEWLALVAASPSHHTLLGMAGGWILLLALLRWRDPDARLLAAMAVIPHGLFFYDELPLWLVPRTHRQSLSLTWCSWLAFGAWVMTSYDPVARTLDLRGMARWTVWLLYFPCLILVLRRPNAGELPEWMERATKILPTWLRGRPTSSVIDN